MWRHEKHTKITHFLLITEQREENEATGVRDSQPTGNVQFIQTQHRCGKQTIA